MLDRQLGGLFTFQDACRVGAGQAGRLDDAAAVAYEAARLGKLAIWRDRRDRVAEGERRDGFVTAVEEGVNADDEAAGPQFLQLREGRLELIVGARREKVKLEP